MASVRFRTPTRRLRALVAGGAALVAACAGCESTVSGSALPSAPAVPSAGAPSGSGAAVELRFRPVVCPSASDPTGLCATLDPSVSGSAGPTAGGSGAAGTADGAAGAFNALRCDQQAASPPTDPASYIAACSEDGTAKYLLGPAVVVGSDVAHARAGTQQATGEWIVLVDLTADAEAAWAEYTASHIEEQVALTVDDLVLSAPVIQSAITSNPTTLTGQFDQESAQELARRLDGG